MAFAAIKKKFSSRIKNRSFSEIVVWLSARLRQQIHSRLRNKGIRNFAIKTSASIIGKTEIPLVESKLVKQGNADLHLNNLRVNGYTVMDNEIDESLINKIISYSQNLNCFDPYRPDLGEFKPEQAPAESHIAHFKRGDLVSSKDIMDIANDEAILNMMQGFLGAKPTISNVCMWWSFGGRKGAEEAQNFHRDNDDIKFCKLFIYLTDVDDLTGPHIYVKGTANSPKLRVIKRYSDEEIEDTFGKENIMKFIYPKGTVFLVDTYGFHKGMPPKTGSRLLLQIEYSLHSIGYQDYAPVNINYEQQYNKYANRLLVDFEG